MANTCKTCLNPQISEINTMLVNEIPARKILNKIKGVTVGSLQRHKENCIRSLFAPVIEQRRASLLARVDEIYNEIIEVRAAFLDNPNVRLGILGKMRDAIDLEAKLTGAYLKEQENPNTALKRMEAYRLWAEKNPHATVQSQKDAIKVFAQGAEMDEAEFARRAGVTEIEAPIG